jgi:hypothetical protein
MLEEIVVEIDDRRGVLAEIGELLGARGVNIETLSAYAYNGRGVLNLVADDGDEAAEILTSNGYKIAETRPVLQATLEDRPGELGRYCRKLAEAGIDISAAYVANRGGGESQLILAVDKPHEATTL